MDLYPVWFLADCSLKPWKLDNCTPLFLSLEHSASFCYFYLYYTVFFYTVTTHFTTSRWHLSPLLLSTNKALCVSCTAPDKQHEKQHSHQSQRQHPLCCAGMQLCVRLSVCLSVTLSKYRVCRCVYERERETGVCCFGQL